MFKKQITRMIAIFTAVIFVTGFMASCGSRPASATPAPSAAPAATQAPAQTSGGDELNPHVIQTKEIGKHGGTLFAAFPSAYRGQSYQTLGFYEPVLSWDVTNTKQEPNLVESFSISDDATVYQFVIRKGLKWSNGDPVTTEDVRFYIDDIASNTDLSPTFPNSLMSGGKPVELNVIDDMTFEFIFAEPNLVFMTQLANEFRIFFPSNYLKQFHAGYADAAALSKMVQDEDFETWMQLFNTKRDFLVNTEYPVFYAWMLTDISDDGLVRFFDRNPYYFKTDTAGNKLPYFDSMQVEYVENYETLKLKIIAGEVDYINAPPGENFNEWPAYMQHAEAGNYRLVQASADFCHTLVILPNSASVDPQKGQLLSNKDFRIALSHAINREELSEIVYNVGEFKVKPAQQSPLEASPFYHERLANQYLEYDTALADKILDELGISARGADGYRLGPDGEQMTFQITIPTYNDTWVDVGNIVAGYWKAVGLNVEARAVDPEFGNQLCVSNEVEIYIVSTGSGGLITANLDHITSYSMGQGGWYQYWALAWSRYISSDGADGVEPPDYAYEMRDLRSQVLASKTVAEQKDNMKKLLDKYADVFPCISIGRPVGQFLIASNELGNTPDDYEAWVVFTFGVGGNVNPCAFFRK